MIYLQNCIEQPFESQYVRVARNNEFAEEFLFNIRVIFQSLDTRMSMYPIKYYGHECCTWQVTCRKTFTMFDLTSVLIFGMYITKELNVKSSLFTATNFSLKLVLAISWWLKTTSQSSWHALFLWPIWLGIYSYCKGVKRLVLRLFVIPPT